MMACPVAECCYRNVGCKMHSSGPVQVWTDMTKGCMNLRQWQLTQGCSSACNKHAYAQVAKSFAMAPPGAAALAKKQLYDKAQGAHAQAGCACSCASCCCSLAVALNRSRLSDNSLGASLVHTETKLALDPTVFFVLSCQLPHHDCVTPT